MDEQTLRRLSTGPSGVRLIYGNVIDDSPLLVQFDGSTTGVPAVAHVGLTLTVADRVSALKDGSAPALVLGVIT